MILPKRLFFTGVPGSRWSGISQYLSQLSEIDNSDQTLDRNYTHGSFTGHKGSYFGKGMEFDANIEDVEDPISLVDSPFSGNGMRIVKSHDWAYKLPLVKRLFHDDWIMLVYRPDLPSFFWWHEAGGFDITYPCYDAYGDSINMLNEICKQNEEILKFASVHDATWKNFTSSWIEETFGERIEVKDTWADILVTVIK